MHNSKIKALNDEYNELVAFFRENDQVSFEMYINDTYKKTLILSAASFFEFTITKAIHDYAETSSGHNVALVAFLDNKALNRQYHTLFSWDDNNTNHFWGLFGDDLKNRAKRELKERELGEAESAFLTIGRERNNLVHRNYIEAVVNATFEELYAKYIEACKFVDFVIELLSE